jgi:hypothetical protein
MSQDIFNDINPTVTSGTELADLLNDFKDAVVSGFSGTSRPANLQAGGYWIDTTNDPTQWSMRFYDGTTDILLFTLDITNGIASVGAGGDLLELAKISDDIIPPVLKFLKQRSGGAQTLVGDNLGQVEMYGTDSGGIERKQANIKIQTLDNTSLTNLGSFLAIELANAGTGSLAEIVRLMNARMGINTTNPQNAVHVRGDAVRVERAIAATDSAKVILEKKRIAGNGQVLNADGIAKIEAQSTDQNGTQFEAASMEVVATETNTDVARGNKIVFKTIAVGSTSLVERASIDENGLSATALNIAQLTSEEVIVENISNTTTSPKIITDKARIAGSGQVLDNDGLGKFEAHSTDVDGDDFEAGFIEFYATENHDNTNRGTKVEIATIAPGETALVTRINIDEVINIPGDVEIDGGLFIAGNLEVQGTTTTIDSATLSVVDANISVNVGGTQSAANTNNAGITVEMTDATDARIAYDSTLASKFKIGDIGSESQIVSAAATQTLTNKTLTSPVITTGDINNPDIDGGTIDTSTITSSSIVTPSRLDVKQDTEANLTTYAASATNGQFVFATDTKVMYQIVDNALTTVGSGSGGVSTWIAEKYETLAAADLAKGNNATFGNGGSFAGTLSIQPAGIDGKSLQYLQAAGSLNDWFEIVEPRTTTEGVTGKTNVFQCLVEYNGNDNEQKIVIWDDTNNVELGSALIKATGAGANRLYEIVHTIPTTCLSYQIGIQNLILNNGKLTLIDNSEVDYNKIASTSFLEPNVDIRLQSSNGVAAGTLVMLFSNITYNHPIFGYNQTTGAFTVRKDGYYTFTWTTIVTNTAGACFSINQSSALNTTPASIAVGEQRGLVFSNAVGGEFATVTFTEYLLAGTIVRPITYTAFTDATMTLTATCVSSSGAVISNGTLGANSTTYTPAIVGFGTPTGVNASWNRITGTNLAFIQGKFTSGTPTAVPATFSLPSGLTIKSGIVLKIAGMGTRSDNANEQYNLIAQAGNSFFNFAIQGGIFNGLTILNGNSVLSASVTFSFTAIVEIEQWNVDNSVTVLSPMIRIGYASDVKAQGTAGQTITTTATAMNLNTVSGDTSFFSVVSNQIRLSAGMTEISASYPVQNLGATRNWIFSIFNVTTSTTLARSQTQPLNGGAVAIVTTNYNVSAVVTNETENIIEIRGVINTGTSAQPAANFTGFTEKYTDVILRKLR